MILVICDGKFSKCISKRHTKPRQRDCTLNTSTAWLIIPSPLLPGYFVRSGARPVSKEVNGDAGILSRDILLYAKLLNLIRHQPKLDHYCKPQCSL